MVANLPLWTDLSRDLDAALRHARSAEETREALLSHQGRALLAEALGLALGKHLDDAYTATERAIERVVMRVDRDRPEGRDSHRQLLLRASNAVPSVREAIISGAVTSRLMALLSFRHAYRNSYAGFEIDRALPNVRLALDTVPDAAREVEAFCRAFGIIPTNTPPRYAGPAGDAPGAERD
jgi:hypothetical protein